MILAAVLFASISFPLDIPAGCHAFAAREGFPKRIESISQALRYRSVLHRMKDSDPVAKACKDAVKRTYG